VYHEEDSDKDDEIDLLLLEEYALLELEQGALIVSYSEELVESPVTIVSNDLEHGPALLLETVEVTETSSIIPLSSSPSQTFIMEVRRGEGRALNFSPTAEPRSSPPPHATVAAGWEGMGVSKLFQVPTPRLISDTILQKSSLSHLSS